MTSTSILSAEQANVNAPTRSRQQITVTWQSDPEHPGYGMCVLESLMLFTVLVTKNLVETHHCVEASFDGLVWTVTVRQLTDLHRVCAWNESCGIAVSGVAR